LVVTVVVLLQAAVAFGAHQRSGMEWEFETVDSLEDTGVGDGTAVHIRENSKVDRAPIRGAAIRASVVNGSVVSTFHFYRSIQ
jgi:hypothetical protein